MCLQVRRLGIAHIIKMFYRRKCCNNFIHNLNKKINKHCFEEGNRNNANHSLSVKKFFFKSPVVKECNEEQF